MKTPLLYFALGTACALAGGPGGPVPGYVLDGRTASIRAIYGIPGAMQLGPPLALPFGAASAGFGPAGDYVLAISDQQPAHAVLVQSLTAAQPALTDLGPVADGTRVQALNASGSAAFLYAGDGTAVQFLTGLPQAPSLSAPVSTGSLLGPITAAVLDDAGACAIAGTGSVAMLCSDGTMQTLLAQTNWNISALVLTNNGRDLIVADRAGKQIVLVNQYRQSANTVVLASSNDGIDTPVGLQTNPAGQVLAADRGASALFIIDSSGRQPIQAVPLGVAPSRLQPLSDSSILLLNDPSALPFTIMDVASLQTFFIPAN